MRFILIANNNQIDDEMIEKINLQYNDIIILFNHHYPNKFEIIKKHPNKILFMRYLISEKKILGLDEYLKNMNQFKLILSYYKADETNETIRKDFNILFEKIKCRKLLINDFIHNIITSKKYIIKNSQTFSTGFLGYLFSKYFSRPHLKEIFNYNINLNKIILVGFTGSYPPIQFNPFHDFEKEQKYYEIDKKNKFLEFINPIINSKNVKDNIINIVNSFLVDPKLQNFIFPISNQIKPIIDYKKKIVNDENNNNE